MFQKTCVFPNKLLFTTYTCIIPWKLGSSEIIIKVASFLPGSWHLMRTRIILSKKHLFLSLFYHFLFLFSVFRVCLWCFKMLIKGLSFFSLLKKNPQLYNKSSSQIVLPYAVLFWLVPHLFLPVDCVTSQTMISA